MPRLFLVLLVLVFYALHQDVWFWRSIHPIAFGVLPVGLFYHAGYTLAISGLIWFLVRVAWPGHLDDDAASTRIASGQTRVASGQTRVASGQSRGASGQGEAPR